MATNLDELGKTYFVVLANNAAAPTATQVKNGHDAGGIAPANNLIGSINVTSTNTEFTSIVTGLNPDTSYDMYIVAEDNIPNLQTNPIKITATTNKLFSENFNNCDGTASFSQFSVTGAQIWGSPLGSLKRCST